MTSALGGFLEGESGDITFPILVFVVEHPVGVVVLDTGLHPQLARTTERLGKCATMFQVHLPADGSGALGPVLRGAGFDPAEVGQVVLTHLHFDHAGGLVDLPNARVVVQRREWADRRNDGLVRIGAYNPADFELGHDRLELEGDHDLFGDGAVVCLLTDGHTAGHQSVRVRTGAGVYVVCGDCCYLRRTLTDKHLPPFGDRARQLASLRRLEEEQSAGATLLFGHDPDQWSTIERTGLS